MIHIIGFTCDPKIGPDEVVGLTYRSLFGIAMFMWQKMPRINWQAPPSQRVIWWDWHYSNGIYLCQRVAARRERIGGIPTNILIIYVQTNTLFIRHSCFDCFV